MLWFVSNFNATHLTADHFNWNHNLQQTEAINDWVTHWIECTKMLSI